MTTTRLILVRHAPVINPDGVLYGHLDFDADCSDADRFVRTAARLPAGAVWYVTPLSRTQQTAAALRAARTDATPGPRVEPNLIEQNFGAWQGRTFADLRADGPGAHRFWLAPAAFRPEGGESFADLCQRAGVALDRLVERHRSGIVVAVCHGGTIRACLGQALGVSPEDTLRFRIDTLSVSELAWVEPDESDPLYAERPEGAWRLDYANWTP